MKEIITEVIKDPLDKLAIDLVIAGFEQTLKLNTGDITLTKVGSIRKHETYTNELHTLVSYIVDPNCKGYSLHPFLDDLIIASVAGTAEVAFMSESSMRVCPLSCMTRDELEDVKGDNIVTVSASSFGIHEYTNIINFIKEEIKENDIELYFENLAKEAAPWTRVALNTGKADEEQTLIILNFFIRDYLLGFVDIFIKDNQVVKCFTARTYSKKNLESQDFDSIEDAILFVTRDDKK